MRFIATVLLTVSLSASLLARTIEPAYISPISITESSELAETTYTELSDRIFYITAGATLGFFSFYSRLGAGIFHFLPWTSKIGKEWMFFSQLLNSASEQAFRQSFNQRKTAALSSTSSSYTSWNKNREQLSQIGASSEEERKLLSFLEKRWLAKSTGFFPWVIKRVCPCFGISVQVHPETTSCYARMPSQGISETYRRRMEAWKELLPHPHDFPLVLTRPCDITHFLPTCIRASVNEPIKTTVKRLDKRDSMITLDVTDIFKDRIYTQEAWDAYREEFCKACKEVNIDTKKILCIETLLQDEIGGIRILSLYPSYTKEIERQQEYLINWVSTFGLSANRVELDRAPALSHSASSIRHTTSIAIKPRTKKELLAYLKVFEESWRSCQPQKNLLVLSTVQLLRGLIENVSGEKWDEISRCGTRASATQLAFSKIQEELQFLAQEKEETLFFDTASHVEQIHANLSALLEIFSPFTNIHFPAIYAEVLKSLPPKLKPLTSYGVHASGMSSLAGVFKATERMLGRIPNLIFGENAYFECINAAKLVSQATLVQDATEKDWQRVDLILANFNPVLRRVDFKATEYHVETVAESLRKALFSRIEKPLVLAVDCTLDYIDSKRVGDLLAEFQEEIKKGVLNVICYRSGLKFDLFGMDNYSGAPFYMIHSEDSRWKNFDSLLTDPVLQTDRLSLNWFCLAYKNVAPYLELYRKEIFDNTRALLNSVPKRLFDPKSSYRIVPVSQDAEAAFLDIKISGPLHEIRGSTLAGGSLYLKCMKSGHPIFYRPSLGFYHPNFTMIFGEECSTIRLTLGLDPSQVDVLADCFAALDALNADN